MEVESIFVDTNLFLRYLTNDIPVQVDAAEKLFKDAADGKLKLLANPLVMAEIIWTLESFYRLPKVAIQDKILAILNTPGLEIIEEETVLQAIHWYAEKNVDFIDAYNAAWMLKRGIREVYTFDRKHFERFGGLTITIPGLK